MAETTPEQHRVSRIINSFTEPPVSRPRLIRLAQGLKEKFGVGKYMTHPDVRGGVGDLLDIRMGKAPLNDFLPPGVQFRGYRHVGREQGENRYSHNSTHWHFYSPAERQIGLAVECEPNASFKLPIKSTPIAGLVLVHEMGHAWEDHDNPQDRAIWVKNNLPVVILQSVKDEQIGQWYQQARSYATYKGRLDQDLFRRLIETDIVGQARRISLETRSKGGDLSRLVSPTQFDEITEEIGRAIAQQVLNRGLVLDQQGLTRSVESVRQTSNYLTKQFLRRHELESEARAWLTAEQITKALKKRDPKINLWDGNEKTLQLLKVFLILHHTNVKFEDIPEGEMKELLRGITSIAKIYD